MSRKPLTEKLILYFILINLTAIGIVGYYSFRRQGSTNGKDLRPAGFGKIPEEKADRAVLFGEIRLVKSLPKA
jgi:hypothetical protein